MQLPYRESCSLAPAMATAVGPCAEGKKPVDYDCTLQPMEVQMEIESYWERYLTHTQIQQNGAVSNLADGIPITTQGINTRPIAWPGNGFQTEAVHVLTVKPGEASDT